VATGCAVLALALWVSNCRLNRLLSRSPADEGPLEVFPAQVEDSALAGSTTPRRVTVIVSGAGAWRATNDNPWIDLSPTSGGARSLLTISLAPQRLGPGTHEGIVKVTTDDESEPAAEIAVKFEIQQPILKVSPNDLSYTTRFDRLFFDTLQITNEGTGPLVWTATVKRGGDDDDDDDDDEDEENWLLVGALAGAGNGFIPIRVDSDDMREGTYRRTIVITAPGAKGSPAEIEITLRRRR
jgi:hypothetical protein